jgi:glycerophosphoryl diester phosphodiesterase
MARRFGFSGAAEIIAHRGFSARAPENTLAAIEAAIDADADAVEFDLHVTADGTPVLFHDATLERTTDGEGALSDRTLAQLRGLDAGSWFAPEFAGEPIPTLAEALGRLRAPIRRVYPEVKGYRSLDDLGRMVDIVSEHRLQERTAFISMDWTALEHIRGLHANLGIGYIVEKASRAREGIERAAGDAHALVDFKASLLLEDRTLAEEAGRRGVELAVWTVDEPTDAARLLDLGVPRITTNRVAELTAWKATL